MIHRTIPSPEPVKKETIVEALEDGAIVRVSERYARSEGLLILRKLTDEVQEQKMATMARTQRIETVKSSPFELLRKPLKRDQNDVFLSLKPNFHWELSKQRKLRNLSRKQVADAVGVGEYEIKILENGILPSDDFILISKVEKYFGVNLRRDGGAANAPPASKLRGVVSAGVLVGSGMQAKTSVKSEEAKKETEDKLMNAEDLLADEIELE